MHHIKFGNYMIFVIGSVILLMMIIKECVMLTPSFKPQ